MNTATPATIGNAIERVRRATGTAAATAASTGMTSVVESPGLRHCGWQGHPSTPEPAERLACCTNVGSLARLSISDGPGS